MKTCTKCGETKPLDAFGSAGKYTRASCKVCHATQEQSRRQAIGEGHAAYLRAYRRANPERYREYRQQGYWKDPEIHRTRSRQRWASMSDEDRRAYYRASYNRNIESVRQYYQDNKPKYRERERRYRQEHPGVYQSKDMRRRARKIGAIHERINRDEIIARDAGICHLCGASPTGRSLTLDHVIPLVRGGTHTSDNLKVACRSCNSRKQRRLLSELDWYTP